MLSNQILHKPINDIHEIMGVDCSVWSMEGKCLAIAGMNEDRIKAGVDKFLKEGKDEQVCEDEAFFLIRDNYDAVYVLALHEVVEQVAIIGRLCISQFQNLIHAYKERLDKNHFFQNLLLDNLLLVDIFNQAKKLGIEVERRRVVFLIEPKNETDNIVLETMKGLYATGSKDFVTSVDEGHIILIKEAESAKRRPVREVTVSPERSYMENSRITAFMSRPQVITESMPIRISRNAMCEASNPSAGTAVPVS